MLTQDHYFLNMSCSGPGRYLMTVSRMLSSSSSGSSPQPGGMAFLGRVRLPSELASMAAWASASRSSFFLMPYCEGKGSQAGLAYSPPQYPAWVALMQYTERPGPSCTEETNQVSQLGKTPAESQAHPIHQGSRTDPVQVLENHTENGTTKRCPNDTWDRKEKKGLGVAGEMNQQLSDLLLFRTGT